ncbi:hypothetical protein STEG23_034143 [Scotinomys teguina]
MQRNLLCENLSICQTLGNMAQPACLGPAARKSHLKPERLKSVKCLVCEQDDLDPTLGAYVNYQYGNRVCLQIVLLVHSSQRNGEQHNGTQRGL